MSVLRRVLAIGGRVLAVFLVTLALLEIALRVGYLLMPPTFQRHLLDTRPPDDLPEVVGETAWALRDFPTNLARSRAFTSRINTETDGDLYYLTCAPQPDETTTQPATVRYDALGFRLDQTYPLTGDNPDVLVLGDSFGASGMIQRPFWADVSERVWGLSVSGAGPSEQVDILRTMLATRDISPQVIVFPYFEGNDLLEAYTYPSQVADYDPPEQPGDLSPFARLYTVQAVSFLWEQVSPQPSEPLPPEATRSFEMSLDSPPASDAPVTVYAGDPAWGWAFDSRAGLSGDNGITEVRLHAGATCDGPVLSVDDRTDRATSYRADILEPFNFPEDSAFTYSGFRLFLGTDLGPQTVTVCAESVTGEVIQQTRQVDVQPCPLPLTDTTGREIIFYPHYMGVASLGIRAITGSQGYANTEAALLDMQALADEIGAELVVLYLPSKIHTYIDLVEDDELRTMGDLFRAYGTLPDNTFTEFAPATSLTTDEALRRLRENVGNQRSAIQALAILHGITFIDATPALQAAAAEGETPFHPADTHINDTGSNVIREVLRAELAPYLE